MSNRPEGFAYDVRGGDVHISRHGRRVTVLRGAAARRFLLDLDYDDPQLLMARLTGNYKRGNERARKQHPRNQGR